MPLSTPGPRTAGRQPVDLLGVGEAMVLLQPSSGTLAEASTFSATVAGAELNACAAVAALGGRAALLTRVGADPFGERVRAHASDLGIHLVATEDPVRPTGVFFKQPTSTTDRRVQYYRTGSAAAALDETDLACIAAADIAPRAVLVSGLTAALGDGGPARAVLALARTAHARGIRVVVDANLRPALGLARSLATLHALLPITDLLVLGPDEGLELMGTADPHRIVELARQAGCREVVVKAGGDGCFHEGEDGRIVHLPADAVDVVDTVGAGDAFTGSYAWARLRGWRPAAAARLATTVAGMVVGMLGDTEGLPDARARDRLLGAHRENSDRGAAMGPVR